MLIWFAVVYKQSSSVNNSFKHASIKLMFMNFKDHPWQTEIEMHNVDPLTEGIFHNDFY